MHKKHHYFATILLTLAFSNFTHAGDFSQIELIGFSPDGKHVAYEEYGIEDGSGFGYSNIRLLDTEKNDFVKKHDSREELSEEFSFETFRKNAHKVASESFKNFKIKPGNKGDHLLHHLLTDIDVEAKAVRFATQPLSASPAYQIYELEIKETDWGTCTAPYETTSRIFTLTINDIGLLTQTEQTLQKDTRLPKSRGCATSYRISEVYLYQDKRILVFLNMFAPAFEGDNARFLAVSGKLKP